MEKYSITSESRAENLERWSDDELRTLHNRLVNEVIEADRVLDVIENILDERSGLARHVDDEAQLPLEYLGERPELPDLED